MNDPLPPARTPNPAPAPHGGKSGEPARPVGALDRAMFAEIVKQREQPAPEKPSSPPPAAEADPETPEAPETQAPPGEDISSPETPEPETPENPEPEPENPDLSQKIQTGNPELDAVLNNLNADAVKHFVEIANAVQNGETSIGQVKRQFKLGKEENAELTQLRERVKQLETQPPAPANNPVSAAVAKLKTVQEVDERTSQAEQGIEAIEDFLEENPSGGEISGQTFSRAQLVERKRQLQQELRQLPTQRRAIEQHAQFTQAQETVTTATRKDFPQLNDPDHPDTKLAAEFVQGAPWLNQYPNRDYLALALAVGHRTLQADKTRRTAGPAAKPVQTSRPGTVPAKKPHVAAPAAARPSAVPTGELVKAVKDKDSLAALLSATGR